jgi:hypothetical protein
MTRFRVAWNGTVQKTIAIETPADACYHIWSRYREDFAGGEISVNTDEGRGVRLAQISFPVRIVREIEADNPAEAVRSFLYDDRVPSLVRVQDIEVGFVGDPPPPPDPDEPELPFSAAA